MGFVGRTSRSNSDDSRSEIGSSYIDNEDYHAQINYCCGHKEIVVSSSFKQEKTRQSFASMVFAFKLIQYTFVVLFLFEMMDETDNIIVGNIFGYFKRYNWAGIIAGVYLLVAICLARSSGIGKRRPLNLFLFALHVLATTVLCTTIVTPDIIFPFRYTVIMAVSILALNCFAVCLFTTVFEVDFADKAIFSRIFAYFLVTLAILHVFFIANLQPKYDIEYFDFLQCIGIGGGIGLFISMVMIYYVQELMAGHCIPLREKEYIYVALLM